MNDPEDTVTDHAYDARGNRTSVTDALGNQTLFAYDVMNRLVKIAQADGSTTSFTYDDDADRLVAPDRLLPPIR